LACLFAGISELDNPSKKEDNIFINNIYMDEDKIILEILNLKADVKDIRETMATKNDIADLLAGQDKMIQILSRVDQERVFTNEKIRQLEADVKTIKLQLQIA